MGRSATRLASEVALPRYKISVGVRKTGALKLWLDHMNTKLKTITITVATTTVGWALLLSISSLPIFLSLIFLSAIQLTKLHGLKRFLPALLALVVVPFFSLRASRLGGKLISPSFHLNRAANFLPLHPGRSGQATV